MNITNTQELRASVRMPFAWPGGYPIYIVLSDGGMLCHACSRTEYREMSQALRDPALRHSGWCPVAAEVLWEEGEEGPEPCAHCGKELEAAYRTIKEETSDE
jgi:hypothetical protein